MNDRNRACTQDEAQDRPVSRRPCLIAESPPSGQRRQQGFDVDLQSRRSDDRFAEIVPTREVGSKEDSLERPGRLVRVTQTLGWATCQRAAA
jgi:hypothetical protein